jgi:hypothetical protein
VQRTCEALTQHGFVELTTLECLQKELQVQTRSMPVLQLDFLQHKVPPCPRPDMSDFEVSTAVSLENTVCWDIKTQFVPHKKHITSPLQSSAS